jgi:hypothetical protein
MPILTNDKQLAQALVSTTGTVRLYTCPNSSTKTYVRTIAVCNTTAGTLTYSIYVNQNGSEIGDRYALYKAKSLTANTTDLISTSGVILDGVNASIMVVASAANGITFTMYGTEVVLT